MALDPILIDTFVLRFSPPLEGCTRSPYLDVRGLLTVGIGCLIDPPQMAAALPWEIAGEPAPVAEVLAQLRALKAQPGLARYAWNTPAVLSATTIRLTDAGVVDLAKSRMIANEVVIRKSFPRYDSWPADAKLFAHSMAWAIGGAWGGIFGNCRELLCRTPPAFLLAAMAPPGTAANVAAAPCDIRTAGNPGIVPRNAQNRLCLSNAQVVLDRGLDASVLHWPKSPLSDGSVSL